MFAYNPQVQDRSGEIYGAHQVEAAKATAAGQMSFGKSIGEGLGGLGGGIGANITKSRENAIKYDTAAGMLETYKQNADALGLDMQMLQGIEQKYANKPNELIGALTVVGKIGENNMELNKSKQIADIYGANNKDLAMWKAWNTGAAVAEPKLDANYARQAYQSLVGRGYTHEQAIEGMNASGMAWGVQYITPPARGLSIMDQVLPNQTSPAPTR